MYSVLGLRLEPQIPVRIRNRYVCEGLCVLRLGGCYQKKQITYA
jgi:hypothetical protein